MGLFAQLPVLPLGLINEIIALTIFSSTSMRLTYCKLPKQCMISNGKVNCAQCMFPQRNVL